MCWLDVLFPGNEPQVQAMSTEIAKVQSLQNGLEDINSKIRAADGDNETLRHRLEAVDTRTDGLQQNVFSLEAQLQAAASQEISVPTAFGLVTES